MMPKEERDRLRHDLMASDKYSSSVWKLFGTCDALEAQIAALTVEKGLERAAALREATSKSNFVHILGVVNIGLNAWKNKYGNDKWWRKIDGTPIPNDLCVNIAESVVEYVQQCIALHTDAADQSALDDLIRKRVAEARLQEARWWFDAWDGENIHGCSERLVELERATAQEGK